MGRGGSGSSHNQAAAHILYGDTDPRQERPATDHYVTIDGITYKSALPRYAPKGYSVESSIRRMILRWPGIASNRSQALHYKLCVLGTRHCWHKGQLVNEYDDTDEFYTDNHRNGKPLLEDADEQYTFLKTAEEKMNAEFEEREQQRDPAEVAEEKQALSDALDALLAQARSQKAPAADSPAVGSSLSEETEPWEDSHELSLREQAQETAELNRRTREDVDELSQTTEAVQNLYPLSEGCSLVNFPDDVDDDWLDAIEETAQMISVAPVDSYESYPSGDQQKQRFENNRKYARQVLKRVAAIRAERS